MNIAAMIRVIRVEVWNLKTSFIAAICGVMLYMPMCATASSTDARTHLDIRVVNPIGTYVYRAPIENLPYTFIVRMHSDVGVPNTTADLYFGAIAPNGQATYSWVGRDGSPMLVSGLQPISTDLIIPLAQDLAVSAVFRFTGTEVKGMYTLFAVLVHKGKNASDTANWINVSMMPLFVE